jgi:hypothetical protein
MNDVYVIIYNDPSGLKNDVIEGVVQNQLDFKEWLTQHNEQRRELDDDSDYFVEETEDDFELKKVPFFTF